MTEFLLNSGVSMQLKPDEYFVVLNIETGEVLQKVICRCDESGWSVNNTKVYKSQMLNTDLITILIKQESSSRRLQIIVTTKHSNTKVYRDKIYKRIMEGGEYNLLDNGNR